MSRASSYLSPILLRAILRALLRTPGRLAAVVVLVAVAITVYAGTFIGLHHIADTADALYRDLHRFDLDLRVTPQAQDGVPSVEDLRQKVPTIAAATWRLVVPGTIEFSPRTVGADPARTHAESAMLWAISPAARPSVGDVRLTAGQFLAPGRPDDIVIDTTFAADWDIRVGDTVTLRVGSDRMRATVRGIGVLPEHLMSSSLPDYPVPIRGTQAGILLSQEGVAALREHALVNSLALTLTPSGTDREATRAALLRTLSDAGVAVQGTLWPEDQFSIHCTRVRLLSYRDFLPTLIVVFNGLAFLVLLLTVRRMAQLWRREIGTLLSYGVHRSALILGWALALGLLVGLGGVIGAVASLRVANQVSGQFLQGTGFPLLLPPRSLAPLWHAEALCLGIVWPAVLLPILPLLWHPPAQLLRDDTRGSESSWVLQAFRAIGRPLDRLLWLRTPEKIGFRNVFRRPGVFLSSTLCMAGMLVAAGGMYLFEQALPRGLGQFLDSQRWDALIELAQPAVASDIDTLLRPLGVPAWEGISVAEGSVRRALPEDSPSRSYYLVAESLTSPLRIPGGLGLVQGRYLTTEQAPEVVINLRLSQSLALQVGDRLTVGVGAAPAPDRVRTLKIVGISTNYAINQVFVSRHTLGSLQPGPLRFAAVVMTRPPGQSPDADWTAPLRAQPNIVRVVPWAPIRAISLKGCDALTAFVRIYGDLSAAVAIFLIVVFVQVSITDRASEYALLRSLGWSALDVLRSLLAEVLLLSLCATLVSLPLTRLSTWIFQQRLMQISDFVPIEFSLAAWATLMAPALLLMLLSALPASLRAARIPLAALLRMRA